MRGKLANQERRKPVSVYRQGEKLDAYLITANGEERIVYPAGQQFNQAAGKEKVDVGIPQPITVDN